LIRNLLLDRSGLHKLFICRRGFSRRFQRTDARSVAVHDVSRCMDGHGRRQPGRAGLHVPNAGRRDRSSSAELLGNTSRRALRTIATVDLTTDLVEARVNSLIQDASHSIDDSFDLWLINAQDDSKWVEIGFCAPGFGAHRGMTWGNSFEGCTKPGMVGWDNNQWYKFRIEVGSDGNLQVGLYDDALTTASSFRTRITTE